jgi:Ion channel
VTIETDATQNQESGGSAAEFRYGVVFVLMLALVVFVISAPSANWSRAVALAMEGAALVVAIATAREPDEARYRKALVVGVVLIGLTIIVATGTASLTFTTVVAALVTVAVPASIIRGSLRLLREQGVTFEAVAGGLAIYLALGLVFAWIIGFIIHVSSTPYFAQHTNGTDGDWVYFSFTVLTTTGFGDFSAATPTGHALAVIEMLTGQLYLVTIIGLLIGNYISRRMTK